MSYLPIQSVHSLLFSRTFYVTVSAVILFCLFTFDTPFVSADAEPSKKTSQPETKFAPKKKTKPVSKPKLSIEFQQYRVRVSVAVDQNIGITPKFRQRIFKNLRNYIERSYGRMWVLDFQKNEWLTQQGVVGLEQLSADNLYERFLPKKKTPTHLPFDKLLVLTIQRNGPYFLLAGREFDTKSRKLNPIAKSSTTQPREVSRKLFSLLPVIFHPVFEILKVDGSHVDLRLQAAMFPPSDSSVAQLHVNDVIVPYFRYLDKKKVVQKIRTVPWTYTIVDKIDQQFITGTMVTDRGGRLGTGRRRRVEVLGMMIRPRIANSRLKMVYQSDESRALVGYNVNLIPKKLYRDKRTEPLIRRYSGRDGIINIPINSKFPIIWVYVYSGTALIARVPYCPGVTNDETIPVPDDSLRLAAEGEISLLKNELIDIVARRATLMALAKKHTDDESLTEAKKQEQRDEKFAEIGKLKSIREFEADLARIRRGATAAKKLKNRFAERRINRLCDDTAKLIVKFLDREQVRVFFKELKEGIIDKKK